ncbi:MAG TPA: undecaprenyl-diphosphatase UppP [Chthonomonadaceae bacterium]|nr:undecaprenyl-diphosphatase UppP [Chthonomonadaceae bacterium]
MAGDVVHISWLQAVLLGLLQGLTEFLPVSSTAHMAIAPQLLFGLEDPGAAFSAVVQLGPIIAIVAYFRNDLARYVQGILRTRTPANLRPGDVDARLGWYTLLATIPGAVFGLLLERRIDNEFRRLDVIAFSLIALALVLWLAEKIGKRTRSLRQMTFPQSQAIGWAQVLSLIPGTSRSGVTITAGLFEGLDRESAARFSFLLSIPFITAAGFYKLFKVLHKTHLGPEAGPYLLGALVAGLFAYVVVRWFLGYMKEHNTGIFIVYRILLGIALLVMIHFGLVHDSHRKEAAPSVARNGMESSPRPHPVAARVGLQ